MSRSHWAFLAALGLALSALACDDTLRGVEKDTKENTATAKRKAEEIGLDEAARKAADGVKHAAETAGRKIAEATDGDGKKPAVAREPERDGDVERTMDKAKTRVEEGDREIGRQLKGVGIHADVKQALMKDDAVDASHIDVDVDEDRRLVLLRGSVPTTAQKTLAENIARARAKDYKVQNELAVIGGR